MIDFPQAQRNRLTWIAAAWFLALASPVFGQESAAWKTGPAFRKQLDASVSVAWDERPLREGVSSFSQSVGIAVFLDRRLDPGQNVSLTVRDQPAEQLLRQLAEQVQGGISIIGPVVYLGPAETANKLSTLAVLRRQEIASLPNETKARLLKTRAWSWEELAEPRALVDELGQEAGITIANPQLVPHDVWTSANLPSLAWIDRLTLVLAGFGLTYEFDGSGAMVRLVPIPEEVLVEKTYTPRGEPASLVAQLRRIVPGAKVRAEASNLVVAAVQDDHDKIERLLSGQSVRTQKSGKAEKRYSLTVENQSAGSVVKTVATQLGKEMKYDPQVVEKLKTNVSFVVKDVTLEELLVKTLEPLGLDYRVGDTALEVVPAEK